VTELNNDGSFTFGGLWRIERGRTHSRVELWRQSELQQQLDNTSAGLHHGAKEETEAQREELNNTARSEMPHWQGSMRRGESESS